MTAKTKRDMKANPGQTEKQEKAAAAAQIANANANARALPGQALIAGQSLVAAPAAVLPPSSQSLAAPPPDLRVNTVDNGKASAASSDGNTAVDGVNAFAESRGRGAAVSNNAGSAFISGQGTVAASGSTPGGLVVAVINTTPAAGAQNAQSVDTDVNAVSRATSSSSSSHRNFNVLVGGNNGLAFSPNQVSDVKLGDTLTFIFGNRNHTVTQSSFQNPCTYNGVGADSGFMPSSNNLTSNNTDGAPVIQYDITTLEPQFFFCEQSMHCMRGMVFEINAPREQPFASFVEAAKAQGAAAMATLAPVVRAAVAGNDTGALIIGTSEMTATLDSAAQATALADLPTATVPDSTSPIEVADVADVTNANTLAADTTDDGFIGAGCLDSDGVLAVNNAGGCFQRWPALTDPQNDAGMTNLVAFGPGSIGRSRFNDTSDTASTSFVSLGSGTDDNKSDSTSSLSDSSLRLVTSASSSISSAPAQEPTALRLLVSTTTTQSVATMTPASLSLKQQVEAFGLPYPNNAGASANVVARRSLTQKPRFFNNIKRILRG
jgi:hypothetical protein